MAEQHEPNTTDARAWLDGLSGPEAYKVISKAFGLPLTWDTFVRELTFKSGKANLTACLLLAWCLSWYNVDDGEEPAFFGEVPYLDSKGLARDWNVTDKQMRTARETVSRAGLVTFEKRQHACLVRVHWSAVCGAVGQEATFRQSLKGPSNDFRHAPEGQSESRHALEGQSDDFRHAPEGQSESRHALEGQSETPRHALEGQSETPRHALEGQSESRHALQVQSETPRHALEGQSGRSECTCRDNTLLHSSPSYLPPSSEEEAETNEERVNRMLDYGRALGRACDGPWVTNAHEAFGAVVADGHDPALVERAWYAYVDEKRKSATDLGHWLRGHDMHDEETDEGEWSFVACYDRAKHKAEREADRERVAAGGRPTPRLIPTDEGWLELGSERILPGVDKDATLEEAKAAWPAIWEDWQRAHKAS